ncbi:hypothetical protein P43SY_007030 [Pythium insidiosum]|uniref:Transcription factor TFIIIC triple barrel domain-containing protein n=1 Tax=Pythium insidiosum TaxID=114742 RepID=A0AAD5LQX5_PYTIN|nr:hypothetical protein P43SY_007030 [Pythium insidiosum]
MTDMTGDAALPSAALATQENGVSSAEGDSNAAANGHAAPADDVDMDEASPVKSGSALCPTNDVEMTTSAEIAANGERAAEEEGSAEEDDDDNDEEDIFVVVELADFKNHPILDDHQAVTIEGIDTAHPKLLIGDYSLYGQLEETVGTHYFYDTKNRTEANEYSFVGQTTRKIKFTIAPPDEYP